jgi:poly(3-hydroxybutyrate) depolymerase
MRFVRKVVGYTRPVRMRWAALFFGLLASAAVAQVSAPVIPESGKLEQGKIIEKVPCAQRPEQSYALYLPSNYSPSRPWPVVYSFDPGARGSFALQLQKDAAERYGFILAASNNSRNGPWKPQFEAAQAMVQDTHEELSLDDRRMYFAGFSGGARVAAQIALTCRCAAGIMLSGAGLPFGASPPQVAGFVVFSAVGTFDFNYPEVIPLQGKLGEAGYHTWLRTFEGSHQWAPAEIVDEAFAWFRIEGMQSKLESLDKSFVESQFANARKRAASLWQAGDLLDAWRDYVQIVSTYGSLLDVSAEQSKAETLGKEKVVRDAAKRERSDFEEQFHLTAEISAALSGLRAAGPSDSDTSAELNDHVGMLWQRAETEKRPERQRIFKRALSGVFIEAMESGSQFMDQKDYHRAARSFSCATQASPKSNWAWQNLAVAYAFAGSRKDAIRALQSARTVAENTTSFTAWLNSEPAFDRIRSTPEFQSLLKTN